MKKYIINLNILAALLVFAFSFTSCLSDGDETVSLEFANVKKMIVGEWVLESNSGSPRVLTFTDDGYYTDSSDGGTKKHPWRLASDYSDGQPYYGGIYLDGVYYDIVSWGDGHWRLKDRNGKIFDFSRDGGTDSNGDNNDPNPDDGKYETKTYTVNGVSFKMIAVAGGTFTMGATAEQGNDAYDGEKPAHKVTLSGFSIGQTEVTQELWEAVMGSNPSIFFKGAKLPVECVSWNDCQTFIAKLNQLTGRKFRLPTEAEWEYAARGGKQSKGYKYAGSNTFGDVAWYYDNSYNKLHEVATKQANELGLYDMSGNVWEWCQDWYGSYSSSAQTNPTGPTSGSYRVRRGGSWNDDARSCRVSNRYSLTPDDSHTTLGLRLTL